MNAELRKNTSAENLTVNILDVITDTEHQTRIRSWIPLEFTHFPRVFFAILHSPSALKSIYCSYKSSIVKPITLKILQCADTEIIFLCILSYIHHIGNCIK